MTANDTWNAQCDILQQFKFNNCNNDSLGKGMVSIYIIIIWSDLKWYLGNNDNIFQCFKWKYEGCTIKYHLSPVRYTCATKT